VAHLGATVGIETTDKGKLNVTILQIVDPAKSANQSYAPGAGKRYVAVKLQIRNAGSHDERGSANNNVSVYGSDNHIISVSGVSDLVGCANFNHGEYVLGAGSFVTGCVVFEVPSGIAIAKVQFGARSGFGGTGEWLIP
jgi:hypothetical protein